MPKNSILVVGGTGTLGRQVVRKALDEGYEVRCIVKPRMNPADFLRDWGATTVQVGMQQMSFRVGWGVRSSWGGIGCEVELGCPVAGVHWQFNRAPCSCRGDSIAVRMSQC